jgi:hypothetical protein
MNSLKGAESLEKQVCIEVLMIIYQHRGNGKYLKTLAQRLKGTNNLNLSPSLDMYKKTMLTSLNQIYYS